MSSLSGIAGIYSPEGQIIAQVVGYTVDERLNIMIALAICDGEHSMPF